MFEGGPSDRRRLPSSEAFLLSFSAELCDGGGVEGVNVSSLTSTLGGVVSP